VAAGIDETEFVRGTGQSGVACVLASEIPLARIYAWRFRKAILPTSESADSVFLGKDALKQMPGARHSDVSMVDVFAQCT